jgi:tetratricopeptide (TPR) repeat protein
MITSMRALAFFLLLASLSSCQGESFLYIGEQDENTKLAYWFQLLEKTNLSDTAFPVRRKIAGYYQSLKAWDQIIYLYGSYVSANPADPYNALYLYFVAEAYFEKGQWEMANLLYRRILDDYRDLYTPESIHFLSLERLVEFEEDPHRRLSYFKALISRFQEKIDLGYTYYYLSKTYEELRDWDAAMQSLRTFLKYPQTVIPSEPDAWRLAKIKKDFHDSDKDWVEQDLNQLIRRIKSAITDKDWVRLENYRNQVNFFAQSWESRGEDEEFLQNEDLKRLLRTQVANRGTRSFASEIDPSLSSNQEAYLRSTGWVSFRVPIWFFYFRRVEYPQNPELHRGWEWAGIYFGDRL